MSIKSKIQALISAANTKTGESDTTLTDAVQTLVDGYGQGGGGVGELLVDQTATEDVSVINIRIPSGKQNMNCYVVKLTGTTSVGEWIYPVINSETASNTGAYFPKQQNYNNAFIIYARGLSVTQYSFATTTNSVPPNINAPLTNILLCLYYADSVFTSGFNVKVYGVEV